MKKSYISEHFTRVVHIVLLMSGMMLWGAVSLNAQSLPITGTDAVRCGAGELTLTVGWSGQALDATKVKWYTVPFYGTPIATGLTHNTGYIEFTQTFYVDYIDAGGCSQCNRLLVRAVINDNVIDPQISYSSLKFCNNLNQNFAPTIVGASSGTFSVIPSSGLTVNGSTGVFNPNGASPGQYTITFTPVQVVGCNSGAVSTSVNITQALVSPTITFSNSSFCTDGNNPTPTLTGAAGGYYSAVPAGLSINATTGEVDLSASSAGTYTITYQVAGSGGCSPVSDETTLTVVQYPSVTVSYAKSALTKNETSATVRLSGQGDYSGGSYSYTGTSGAVLSIDATTGGINPSTSDAGTYTVTYSKNVTGVCTGTISAQTTVTVYPLPMATIAGTTAVCEGGTQPAVTFTGSNGTSPYTFTYTVNNGTELNVSSVQGVSTAQLNQSTAVAGTYTYALTKVLDATGSYQSVSGQSVIMTINPAPVATFMYQGGSFCKSGTVEPTFTGGGAAGVFTASSANLKFVDEVNGVSATGKVDLAGSTPGTYTVTNTISSCGSVTETAQITVLSPPLVGITGSQTVTYGDLTTYSGTDDATYLYSWSVTGNATIPGDKTGKTVDVSATGAGTYTLTLTVTNASGCQNSTNYGVTVNKAELVVTAMDQSKEYDGAVFTGTLYSSFYSGFKFNDNESVVSGSIAYAGTAIEAVNSGAYVITPSVSSLVADNYSFSQVNGTLVINKAILTVTANDLIVTYGDVTPDLTYTISGFMNGENATTAGISGSASLSTTYTSSTEVSSSPVTITVDNAGSLSADNYIFLTLVNGKITVSQKSLTITSPAIASKVYDGTRAAGPVTTGTLSGFVGDETVTATAVAADYVVANVGTYNNVLITYTLANGTNGGLAGNYSLASGSATGEITAKALSITAPTIASRDYDGTTKAGAVTTGTLSGFVNSETVTATAVAANYSGANVGTYTDVTVTYTLANGANGGDATNYSLAGGSATGTITAKPLTITAKNAFKGYGETLTQTTTGSTAVGYGQLVSGDAVSSVTLAYLNDVHTAAKAVGEYSASIEPSAAQGTGLSNYNITYTKGTMTIYPVIVESTTGSSTLAGYNTLDAAFTAINAGTHSGYITVTIYGNTTEPQNGATLNTSNGASPNYTSVTIVAANNVTVTGTVTLGN